MAEIFAGIVHFYKYPFMARILYASRIGKLMN